MAGQPIKFIELQLSQQFTAGNFVSKIEEMRQKLAVTFTRNRPVLSTVLDDNDPESMRSIIWFDVVLIVGQTKVRLRIRSDKLYFQGFRLNDAGNWFELGVNGKDRPLIDPNSTLLGYGHNYTALLRAAGIDATGGLTGVTVGRQRLIDAAGWLANPPNAAKRAEGLLVMIVLFCEATRFVPVLNYVRRTWQQSLKLPGWIEAIVHRWGALSGCVLFYDANPNYKWVPQKLVVEGPAPNYAPTEVTALTVDELLQYLGILQRDPATIRPPN